MLSGGVLSVVSFACLSFASGQVSSLGLCLSSAGRLRTSVSKWAGLCQRNHLRPPLPLRLPNEKCNVDGITEWKPVVARERPESDRVSEVL